MPSKKQKNVIEMPPSQIVAAVGSSSSLPVESVRENNDQQMNTDSKSIGAPDDPDMDMNSFFEHLAMVQNGKELMTLLLSLPEENSVFGRSECINRATDIILQRKKELLPESEGGPGGRYRFGKLAKNPKKKLFEAYAKIEDESIVEAMVHAVMHKEKPSDVPDYHAVRESRLKINRVALIAHAVIDPKLLKLITEYTNKVSKGDRVRVLTDGIKEYRRSIMDEIAQYANTHSNEYFNVVKETYDEVRNIRPQVGNIKNGEEFRAEFVEMKNKYDRLMSNLGRSGMNAAGVIEDATALSFSGFNKSIINPLNFYVYMIWKGHDLRFLTNLLPQSLQVSAGYDDTDDCIPNIDEYHKELENAKEQVEQGLGKTPQKNNDDNDAQSAVLDQEPPAKRSKNASIIASATAEIKESMRSELSKIAEIQKQLAQQSEHLLQVTKAFNQSRLEHEKEFMGFKYMTILSGMPDVPEETRQKCLEGATKMALQFADKIEKQSLEDKNPK